MSVKYYGSGLNIEDQKFKIGDSVIYTTKNGEYTVSTPAIVRNIFPSLLSTGGKQISYLIRLGPIPFGFNAVVDEKELSTVEEINYGSI